MGVKYENVNLKELDVRVSTGFISLGMGRVASCCEHGDEPSGSIRGGKFHDQLRYRQLLKKAYVLRNSLVCQ
jgi:hypothetical protein